MLAKIEKYVETWNMLKKEDNIVAGISGGADSVCLFFTLLELQKKIGFGLWAVHVNHGLRGVDADRDEAYVKRICEENGVPLLTYLENVESIAKYRKQSTEEAGREVRRECFTKALEACGGNKIALAHHKNDNVETFLMNLVRGSGLKGLGGMHPVQGNVIRPLLCMERKEIEKFLEARGIGYCVDETNASDMYTRNRIRNHVLPYLEKEVNAQAVVHIDDAMDYLRQVQGYMEQQMQQYYAVCVKETAEGFQIEEKTYSDVPEVIKPLVLKAALGKLAKKEKDLEAVHVRDLAELFEKQTGKRIDLPYGIEARRTYDGIFLTFKKASVDPGEVFWEETQEIYFWGDYKITCRCYEKNELECKSFEKNNTKRFDYDIIKNRVSFRSRKIGDYITIYEDGRTQKIKSYFVNEKVPGKQRDEILLVADGNHIMWIAGHRVNSAYLAGEHTKHILEIRIDKGERYGRNN